MKDFEHRIGYSFKNAALLRRALTHASFSEKDASYERLEFLGDRILGFVVAEMLYDAFPHEEEGALAKRLNDLVKKETLKKVADDIGLDNAIINSGLKQAATHSVIADATEAVIAAIYLDTGMEPAKSFVRKYWQGYLRENAAPPEDGKSRLQEWAQGRALPLPHYELIARSGPDHKPDFTVEVSLPGVPPQRGSGASKQIAEKAAATSLYLYLMDHHD